MSPKLRVLSSGTLSETLDLESLAAALPLSPRAIWTSNSRRSVVYSTWRRRRTWPSAVNSRRRPMTLKLYRFYLLWICRRFQGKNPQQIEPMELEPDCWSHSSSALCTARLTLTFDLSTSGSMYAEGLQYMGYIFTQNFIHRATAVQFEKSKYTRNLTNYRKRKKVTLYHHITLPSLVLIVDAVFFV